MDEENDALKVRHVTVEIKCDAFDSVENENDTENNEKKRKIRIDARKTVKDLKIAASKRLLMTSTFHPPRMLNQSIQNIFASSTEEKF